MRIVVAAMLALAMTLTATAQPAVDDLLAKYPAQTTAQGEQLARDVIAAGPKTIQAVCERIAPMGESDDNAARHAISGAAKYVVTGDREDERATLEKALLAAIEAVDSPEVAAFFIRQIELMGTNASVERLAKRLDHEQLALPAAQALTGIGTQAAAKALADGLPSAEGLPRIGIVNALGSLTHENAADAIAAHANADDPDLRLAVWDALAKTGRAEDAQVFIEAIGKEKGYAQQRVFGAALAHARTLAEKGNAEAAAGLANKLYAGTDVPEPVPAHVRLGAFHLVLGIVPESDLKDIILDAAALEDPMLRRDALREAIPHMDRDMIYALFDALPDLPVPNQVDVVTALGATEARAARNQLMDLLDNEHAGVRLAAIAALPNYGGGRVAEALLARFQAATDAEELGALHEAFLCFHAGDVAPDLAGMIDSLAPEKQVTALEVLAAKRAQEQAEAVLAVADAENNDVRLAAQDALSEVATPAQADPMITLLLEEEETKGQRHLQDAIVAAAAQMEDGEERAAPVIGRLRGQSGAQRALLIEVLPRIAGKPAYEQIMADIESEDETVRAAAIGALAGWPKFTATDDIFALAKQVEKDTCRETLLKGYVRLVSDSSRSEGKKVQLLGEALDIAQTNGEKQLFIPALTNLRTIGSLQLLTRLAKDDALRRGAVSAAVQVALPRDDKDPGLRSAYVAKVLDDLLAHIDDEDTRKKVQAHIDKMPQPDAEGFVPLFNGKDLTGWVGAVNGHEVQDGVLAATETNRGNLYTDLTFSDFILRFDFKLTEGANNGLGVRTPLYGHAAYDGMELQIIDNSAHPDLKPYQYHGSIYGVVPAERGALKAPGEWNTQEVRAQGPKITVVVNGETIVDADLEVWRDKPTPDDKDHPGLHNTSGHLALLGHGSRVEFRNIRIKEIEDSDSS
ncbi:MAG: DUF1080 domain-containing protein [Candidatus Hydrogenedentota bacterium]